MQLGVKTNLFIISGSTSNYNDKAYYRLAVVGADGEAGNIDCTDAVYSKVTDSKFVRPATYVCEATYQTGQTKNGRYQFLKIIGVGEKVG